MTASDAKGEDIAEAPSQFDLLTSWYGPGFDGKLTATGDIFDKEACTIAMKNPIEGKDNRHFGTVYRITNPVTGDVAWGCHNDVGPYVEPRQADASEAIARALQFTNSGVATLTFEPLHWQPKRFVQGYEARGDCPDFLTRPRDCSEGAILNSLTEEDLQVVSAWTPGLEAEPVETASAGHAGVSIAGLGLEVGSGGCPGGLFDHQGLCTRECDDDSECGGGGVCLRASAFQVEDSRHICLLSCESGSSGAQALRAANVDFDHCSNVPTLALRPTQDLMVYMPTALFRYAFNYDPSQERVGSTQVALGSGALPDGT